MTVYVVNCDLWSLKYYITHFFVKLILYFLTSFVMAEVKSRKWIMYRFHLSYLLVCYKIPVVSSKDQHHWNPDKWKLLWSPLIKTINLATNAASSALNDDSSCAPELLISVDSGDCWLRYVRPSIHSCCTLGQPSVYRCLILVRPSVYNWERPVSTIALC